MGGGKPQAWPPRSLVVAGGGEAWPQPGDPSEQR